MRAQRAIREVGGPIGEGVDAGIKRAVPLAVRSIGDHVDSPFARSATGAAFSLDTRSPALPYTPGQPAPIAVAAPAGHGGSTVDTSGGVRVVMDARDVEEFRTVQEFMVEPTRRAREVVMGDRLSDVRAEANRSRRAP